MATGTFLLFQEFAAQVAKKLMNISVTDVIKLGLVDSTLTPLVTVSTPTWSTYNSNEVDSVAGGYAADGLTISYSSITRFVEAAGVATYDAEDIVIAQDASSGFTNAYWGILYDSTAAASSAIGFLEMGGPVSEVAGQITITWGASGVFTLDAS